MVTFGADWAQTYILDHVIVMSLWHHDTVYL